METIPQTNYIRCYFESNSGVEANHYSNKLEVYFAETKELDYQSSFYADYLSDEEKSIAENFKYDEDRATYMSCHALLRMILSMKFDLIPFKLVLKGDRNTKPHLSGYNIFFNIAHTRDAFVFAISTELEVGIDLEKLNPNVDLDSILKTSFSRKEREYVLKSESDIIDRFFLCWTRKEAFLKALGTGIVVNLSQVEVSDCENLIDRKLFDHEKLTGCFNEYFLYSEKLKDYYLTIATPHRTSLVISYLNSESLRPYIKF